MIKDSANHELYKCNAEAVHVPKSHMVGDDCANAKYDYALITVNCGFSLAQTYGYFYIASIGDNPQDTNVTVSGYKSDFRLYTCFGAIVESNDSKYLYEPLTAPGMSGSPVYITVDGTDFAVAINSGLCSDGNNITRGIGAYTKWSVTRFLAFNPFA